MELQPFSLRKGTKIEISRGKMTHVPPQKTSFLAYFPHSAGFSPACKRPEFVKKSHFLDETTSTETTSYLKNENNFSLLWSLQMTKVLCGRALDSAIAPNRGIALLGPKKWRKIDPMISILGDPSLFVRPYSRVHLGGVIYRLLLPRGHLCLLAHASRLQIGSAFF